MFARTEAGVQPFIIPTQNQTSVSSAMGQKRPSAGMALKVSYGPQRHIDEARPTVCGAYSTSLMTTDEMGTRLSGSALRNELTSYWGGLRG